MNTKNTIKTEIALTVAAAAVVAFVVAIVTIVTMPSLLVSIF